MMAQWFECKVKYDKIDELSGKEKSVTEPYLVDALSFTEAEVRITRQAEQFVSGEFALTNINRTKIEEIHPYEADGYWFKCKIVFLDIDENSGKEKKSIAEMLVNAENMIQACERLAEQLKSVIVPYRITSMLETKIVDVFPYFENEEENISKESNKADTIIDESLVEATSDVF
ncbi:MAG: DUF4494 domain-containing protein [Bacteroidales bacterium]|nr:DUF4494 domain-containing protein [Bacteroidales bacterium]